MCADGSRWPTERSCPAWAGAALSVNSRQTRVDGFFSGSVAEAAFFDSGHSISRFDAEVKGAVWAMLRAFHAPADASAQMRRDCEQAVKTAEAGKFTEGP